MKTIILVMLAAMSIGCKTVEISMPPEHIISIPKVPRKPVKRGIKTSGYGKRGDSYHRGLDIAAKFGTPIQAIKEGKVITVGFEEKGYGHYVIIQHWNYKSLYAHLSKVVVRPGKLVKDGEVIGLMGNTGKSTGPHLHFEIISGGKKVDPEHYIKGSK